jgi:WD40 repeat protein/tetratricopeptide (TPR) repeat protein
MVESAQQPAITSLPEIPFPGIDPYSYADRNVFFGRETEARDLARLVVMYRGVLLFAESGSGKSSLINAALIPKAINEGYQPEKIRVQPIEGQEIVVERMGEESEGEKRYLPSIFPFDENPERQVLSAAEFVEAARKKAATARPLFIFDQFEEWFTLFEERSSGGASEAVFSARDNILKAIVDLLRAAKLPVKLLISLREDYLAKLTPLFQSYPSLPDQYLRLTILKASQISGIIRQPFESYPAQYPRMINASLAQEIEKDFSASASSAGISLTELQIVCQSLFESGVDTDHLLEFFEKQQRVKGLLEKYLERALQSLAEELREPAVCLLGRMVTSANTRNVIQEDDLLSRVHNEDGIARELLQTALQNLDERTKLIRRESRRDVYYYEISSEFLIGWIRKKSLEHQQRAQQRKLEQSRQEEEKARRRRAILVLLAIAVIGAAALAAIFWATASRREAEARQADSRRLALFAHDNLDLDPELSILLSLQATIQTYSHDQRVLPEAENALREAIEKARLLSTLKGHVGNITDLVFSPDNIHLASSSDDGTVKIWDITQKKLIATLSGHTGAVYDIAFDDKGSRIATAGRDATVRIWDTFHGVLLQTISNETVPVMDLAFSEDGTLLAAFLSNRKVIGWDISSGRRLPVFPGTPPPFDYAVSAQVFPSKSSGERVTLSASVPGNATYVLQGANPAVMAFNLSPDQRQVATATADGTVKFWDTVSGRQLFSLPTHQGTVTKLVFNPDGSSVATASRDGIVNVWDIYSRRRLYTLAAHDSAVAVVAFSPDGTRMATAAEGERDFDVKLWDASPGRDSVQLLPISKVLSSAAISPDARFVALALDHNVRLWKVGSDSKDEAFDLEGIGGKSVHLVFSPEEKVLAAGGQDGSLKLWDLNFRRLVISKPAHTGAIFNLAFSHDAKRIATLGNDGAVRLWDASSGAMLREYSGLPNVGPRSILSADGTWLATPAGNGTIFTVKVGSPGETKTISPDASGFPSICFNSDGTTLATSNLESGVNLWDTTSGLRVRPMVGGIANVYRLAFSRDGRQLTGVGRDGSVKIWDTLSGHMLHTIPTAPGTSILVFGSTQKRFVTLTSVAVRTAQNNQSPARSRLFRYQLKTYPLAIPDLVESAKMRLTRSVSTQECQDYYLQGPQCSAAALIDSATTLARDGNVADATAKFQKASQLDPMRTIEPGMEAGRLAAEAFLLRAQTLARNGDLNEAIKEYDKAKQFDSNVKLDSRGEATRWAVQGKRDQADALLSQLEGAEAMVIYNKALKLDPTLKVSAEIWNSICWYGSLENRAQEIMQACENAVSLEPSNTAYRDSRGLARALTGNHSGAISDFELFINHPLNPELKAQRQAWVATLKLGKNPFTSEVLRALQSQ